MVDTVPLWHALAGPVDRIYVMNVAGDLMDRPLRSPIDVAVRAFAISRKQRFDLELRNVPETVEMILLPAPVDDRELFDFGGGRKLMDDAYAPRPAGPRRRRRGQAPSPRRFAGPGGAATPRSADGSLSRADRLTTCSEAAASPANSTKVPGRMPSRSTITPQATQHR